MYYVYFLKLKNGDVYKGFTSNLKSRITEHKTGKVKSTTNFLPAVLIGYEVYLKESDARRREKFLKTNEGRKLFKKQYREALK